MDHYNVIPPSVYIYTEVAAPATTQFVKLIEWTLSKNEAANNNTAAAMSKHLNRDDLTFRLQI